jgi:hypothetical protein
MFDIIGAIFAAAVYAMVIGVLVGLARVSTAAKTTAFALAGTYLVVVIAVGASSAPTPLTLGPLPVNLLLFAFMTSILFGAWLLALSLREAMASVPLSALVAVNVGRIGGVFFVLLYADGQLSAPFAPSAGWGDVITGMLAVPLIIVARARSGRWLSAVAFWNGFGAIDLIVAISLGLLSAPGTPFRLFLEGPGTFAMTQLPWLMIPTMLVPLFLLIHLTIAAKLRSLGRPLPVVARAIT